MIQDPSTIKYKKFGLRKWYEGFHPDNEEFYLDGPISKRLAIIDFSPDDGLVTIDAKFVPPNKRRKLGYFQNEDEEALHQPKDKHMFTPAFLQVSCFAMVLRTMYMFERKETLGREIRWAFGSPQLLIIPRAGETANAFYHRDGRCLQFFYVKKAIDGNPMYTCLSRDIVAHETGHAIIDGIAPDLLDACTPQSLAIHEGLADLTACLMALESHTLREFVLKKFGPSLENSTYFSSIAEEMGKLLGHKYGLRNLNNEKNLDPTDEKNCVSRTEPHSLSEVLSGSLYRVLIYIYEDLMERYTTEKRRLLRSDILSPWVFVRKKIREGEVSLASYALAKTRERFQRMVFRALDYLPPGEVSFADYGRAVIAVDSIAYGKDEKMRNWITQEFVDRKIINNKEALRIETNFDSAIIENIDMQKLYSSDWTAYWFANHYRDELFIPERMEFEVRPRLLLNKEYDDHVMNKELLFKVSWVHEEEHNIGSRYPQRLAFPVGTTLAIDWETKKIVARLTNAPSREEKDQIGLRSTEVRLEEFNQQREDRGVFLKQLASDGILKRGREAVNSDGNPVLSAIHADISNGKLRIRGAGKLFHIIDRKGGGSG